VIGSESIFDIVRLVADRLGPLRDDVVFLGGAAAALLVTDPLASKPRPTKDVDIAVEIASIAEYIRLRQTLLDLGFREDMSEGAPRCRWIIENIKVDVLATDPPIGFPNRWYRPAIAAASNYPLRDGPSIRLISSPYFLATKLEAFRDRGRNDFLASHDMEDIVTVIDGRKELLAEVAAAPADLRKALADEFAQLLSIPDFMDAVPGHLPGDAASQGRIVFVMGCLRRLATPAG